MEDWNKNKEKCENIFETKLGWDITDFGCGDFHDFGLVLFTIRNGNLKTKDKPYCEKLMVVEEGQNNPLHYHWFKTEDIINRGGGNLVLELFNGAEDGELLDTVVEADIDSVIHQI